MFLPWCWLMKWRQYLEVPKANGLFNPELVGFLPTCVSGSSYLPYNGSITLKFHTFTPRQVKIKWPRKAKLAVRMNASDCYALLLYNLQSIQLCIGLSFLTSVLKSDYKDNRFNCISYGKNFKFSGTRTNCSYSYVWVYRVPKMSIFLIIFVDCSITP